MEEKWKLTESQRKLTETRRPKAYRAPGEMNKTEAAYAMHLESLRRAGLITAYAFEAETLKIGPNCRYTPDFRVITQPDGIIEFHEVKGSRCKGTKPYAEDDAIVKIKAASALHPYKFILTWYCKPEKKWLQREIN